MDFFFKFLEFFGTFFVSLLFIFLEFFRGFIFGGNFLEEFYRRNFFGRSSLFTLELTCLFQYIRN